MPSDPNYIDDISLEKFEEIGSQVAEELKNVDPRKKGSAIPPPPKKGEIIHCQMCRQPMLPEHFSKDVTKRKWEFKWQVHWACKLAAEDYLDRSTVGLMADRKRMQQNRGR